MFGGLTIQAVFLVVIGAALLVTGTSGLRRSIRMKKQKAQRTGKILRISHVEKRDEEGFLIQNYYETRIEYVENGHRQQATVKSVDEFQEGEEVRILKDNERGGQLRIVENEKSAVFAFVDFDRSGNFDYFHAFCPETIWRRLCFSNSGSIDVPYRCSAVCIIWKRQKKKYRRNQSSSYRCLKMAEWTEEKVVYTGRIVLPDPDIYIGWKREKNAQPL